MLLLFACLLNFRCHTEKEKHLLLRLAERGLQSSKDFLSTNKFTVCCFKRAWKKWLADIFATKLTARRQWGGWPPCNEPGSRGRPKRVLRPAPRSMTRSQKRLPSGLGARRRWSWRALHCRRPSRRWNPGRRPTSTCWARSRSWWALRFLVRRRRSGSEGLQF